MTERIITPKTRVAELIDAYPQLEEVLIGYVPAFEKLANPVLRKTVARITTLQQAAAIAGVDVEALINRLRQEVGQDPLTGTAAATYTTEQPDWFSEERVVAGLDARDMLAAGEQPVNQVIADLLALDQGEIYRLEAPFLPAPLLDKAASLGISHWIQQKGGEDLVIYFCKPQGSPDTSTDHEP
jgi:hypothetical protein